MTPEEKARELLLQYYSLIPMNTVSFAKQCALIAVELMIKETGAKYWYNVKQKIEKL